MEGPKEVKKSIQASASVLLRLIREFTEIGQNPNDVCAIHPIHSLELTWKWTIQ